MGNIDKENARRQQEEYKAYRKEIYDEYPEVERFEKRKKRMGKALLLYALAIFVLDVFVLDVPFLRGFFGVGISVGLAERAIFVLVAMGTKWRLAGILYFLVGTQLVSYIAGFRQAYITSWAAFRQIYIDAFPQYPLECSSDFLRWIYLLLILAFAVWITLIPRNRKYADQADELNQEIKAYFESRWKN